MLQGPIWSGTLYHLVSHADDMIKEFIKFNSADSYDEHASVMTTFAYSQARGMPAISNLLAYTKEVTGAPAPFEGFLAVPSMFNATSVTNMTGISKATGALNPSGARCVLQASLTVCDETNRGQNRSINLTATLVSNESVIKAAYERWNASYPAVKDVPNILYCLVLEPLPPILYQRHAKANALGLVGRTDALVVALLSVSWTNASDDALVYSTSNALLEDIKTAAKELGGLDPYIFMNYAGQEQDVIGSYGAENVRRLKQVRQDVDPRGIFTHQVPGGYKIPDK
ncbi:hypothetical protein SLS62_001710 [Diatrype stigma]|uniref:Berberine/berberine-like domain-containing protein n=1 Tax=Diatrype stigma TaxID=117547 RepID=A0AAN9UXG3_9PEZI